MGLNSLIFLNSRMRILTHEKKGKRMKVLIIVEGGVVQGIFATGEIEMYLIDHDNIREGDKVEEARQPFSPDIIQTEKNFMLQLDDTLAEYNKEGG